MREVPLVWAAAQHLLNSSVAKSTLAAYSKAGSTFLAWVESVGIPTPPPGTLGTSEVARHIAQLLGSDNVVLGYILECDKRGWSRATVDQQLAGIRHWAVGMGVQPPAQSALTKRALAGYERAGQASGPKSLRPPILPDRLGDLVGKGIEGDGAYVAALKRALFTVAFHGCLRSSEYLADPDDGLKQLRVEDIVLGGAHSASSWPTVTLLIKQSKANQTGPPERVTLQPLAASSPSCPVRALGSYLRLRQVDGATGGEPLFVLQSGEPVSPRWFNSNLRAALAATGMPPAEAQSYSAHCFRIGAATTAASRGASIEEIKALGRWKSDSYVKYIRETALAKLAGRARARLE